MTQEEKARAYDKAIEKIKYVMAHGVSPTLNKEDLEDIFPELQESEGEKIRKAQLDYWRSVGGKEWHGVPVQETIAWLERQKPIEHFELKAGHWYICHRPFCCRADHLTVKEGEKFMCEKDGVAKGFIIKDPEKYFKESNPPAPMEEDMTWLEKQKPVEWRKEDDMIFNELYDFLINKKTVLQRDCNIYAHWLESLKQRMEE